jgi:hypothetical protein
MTKNDTNTLQEARVQLVKQRELQIDTLATGPAQGEMEKAIDLLLKIQSAIDLLAAIGDEEEYEDEE